MLARLSLHLHLTFELFEAHSHRCDLGIQRQIILRIATLEIAQLLAQLRGALLETG